MIIVDRVEGKFAVCEVDGAMKDIPVKLIRGKVRDGVFIVEKEGIYYVDEDATKARKNHIDNLSKGLWE